jgi:hypothetical protein
MKQLLVIAIALVATNAFASRARVISLSSSPHITDTQSIYSNPAKMFLMGDFVNLESGAQATATEGANAEGMLVRSMGDAKAGLSLGHKSENASVFGLRALMGADFIDQQNPIELSCGMKSGDMTWAGTLVYSNYNKKAPTGSEEKESSAGVRLGALMGAWDFAAGIGLMNTAEDKAANKKLKGTMGLSLYAGNRMDDLYTFGEIVLAGAKLENATSGAELAKLEQTTVTLGVVDSVKKDGNEFFYGASLVHQKEEDTNVRTANAESETTSLDLPVVVGLEAEATSWLTLRGSLTQTVLLDNQKRENNTAGTTTIETAPGTNSTVAAVGAGLKFNKVTIDGSFEKLTGTGATQKLNGNELLTTVGLTYMF